MSELLDLYKSAILRRDELNVQLKLSVHPKRESIKKEIRQISIDTSRIRGAMIMSKTKIRAESSLDVKVVEQENLMYQDTTEEIGHDTRFPHYSSIDTKLMLDNFFKRPVQIDNFPIQPDATGIVRRLRIWDLWASNPAILSKLRNYAYFRGNMKIKIIMNSTKFQFGSLLVSNQPYPDQNLTLRKNIADDNPGDPEALESYLSQSPEMMHIYYGEDYVGEMNIPFICPRNSCRLFNAEPLGVINAPNPYDDLLEMGELIFLQFNPLENFNDSLQAVNVQVLASCDDVELGPPTATFLSVAAESSKDVKMKDTKPKEAVKEPVNCEDEYEEPGPVTKIATAINKVSSKLTDVPMIGKYAKATTMVSSTVARIASAFGFSKPVHIDPIVSFRPQMTENMSFLSGKDPLVKLTADPKQELSLTNFGCESEEDPMSIGFLCRRPTFLHTFTYSTAQAPQRDTLVSYVISPLLQPDNAQMTPMSMCAKAFQYWRGSITFHFKVACSQFHRGKIMFVYEPNLFSGFDPINGNNLTENCIKVLDLAKERECKITVGYLNTKNFSNMGTNAVRGLNLIRNGQPDLPSLENDANAFKTITNGYIYALPYTELFGGDTVASNTVFINTYIYSEDMEFAVPLDLGRGRQVGLSGPLPGPAVERVKAESGDDYRAQLTNVNGTDVSCPEVIINMAESNLKDEAYLYSFGEKILSLRSLLKRYRPMADFEFELDPTSDFFHSALMPLYPPQNLEQIPQSPLDPLPLINGGGGNDSNVMSNHYFNMLRHGYLFVKGGMRYKLQTKSNREFNNSRFEVINQPSINDNINGTLQNNSNDIILERRSQAQDVDGLGYIGSSGPRASGAHEFVQTQNPFAEYEVPYYSNDLYQPSNGVLLNVADVTRSSLFDFNINRHWLRTIRDRNELGTLVLNLYGSIGEDFTFLRFQGAPSIASDRYAFLYEPMYTLPGP